MAVTAAKLKIIYYPDPRLRARAHPVERFDDELTAVAARMIDLMHQNDGVGLAAPQVGLPWRLFVCQPDREKPAGVYVNPKLICGEESEWGEEGCLSLPDVKVQVLRSVECTIEALDLSGKPVKLPASGLMARVWQHEGDHLDGRLIIDRQTEAEKILNRKLLKGLEQEFKAERK